MSYLTKLPLERSTLYFRRFPSSCSRLHTVMSASEFYNLKAEKPNGQEYTFDTLKDKVVLVVNTASQFSASIIIIN